MTPIWLEHAYKDAGLREIRGGESPRIIEMFTHTTYHAKEDEVAWCSAGACTWLEECGIPSPHSAAAKSWLSWGVPLNEPREGCICVILQKGKGHDSSTGSTSGYHVGLWLGEDKEKVYLWGANQSDSVKKSGFFLRSYEICGYRWPEGIG